MKKFMYLFIAIIALGACSDDDEVTENTDERILGTWFLAEVNGIPTSVYSVNECTSQSNITFNANDSATSVYYEGNNSTNCERVEEEGGWSKVSESRYRFSIPELGSQTGTVNFSGDTFTFRPDAITNANIVFERR